MKESSQRSQWLFENHLEFLATHRGTVRRLHDAFLIESDRPEFTYLVLGRDGARALLEEFKTVHLIPGNGLWEQDLHDPRFQKKASLSYMTLARAASSCKGHDALQVTCVSRPEELDVFSQVQASAFTQSQADFDLWHPWLRAANHRNLNNPNQSFYIGSIEGKPVGTTISVFTKDLVGVYGVATLPEFRKRGVATALMARAIADARARGIKTVTLQVVTGSSAEALYEKLGFVTEFKVPVVGR